jgi:hypothetical protein
MRSTYGDTRVAPDNRDNNFSRLGKIADGRGDEGRGAHDIQGRYTKQTTGQLVQYCEFMYAEVIPFRVEDASFFEDLSNDGHGRVDGIGDDKYKCLRSCRCNTNGQIMDDASIDLLMVRSFFESWQNPLTLNRSSLHVAKL